MDVNTGNERAVTAAVDGRLFDTGIYIEQRKSTCIVGIKGGKKLYVILWDFLVQEELRDNSLGKGKRLNYTGS